MEFNYTKIAKLWGMDIAGSVAENKELVMKNISYLYYLKMTGVEEIFYRFTIIFLEDSKVFQANVNKMIKQLGEGYVEILSRDMNYWCNLM